MPVRIPPGMPPWWAQQIRCRHCDVYITAFIPKHPTAWQRELAAIVESISERCHCRKTADEIRELLRQPEQPTDHTRYRQWLQWALTYRYQVHGEGERTEREWTPGAAAWPTKSRSKARSKPSAKR